MEIGIRKLFKIFSVTILSLQMGLTLVVPVSSSETPKHINATVITKAVFAAAVNAGLVAAGQAFNSKVRRQYYQSTYDVVRQRYRPYTTVQTRTFWGYYSNYTYFWSVKPY